MPVPSPSSWPDTVTRLNDVLAASRAQRRAALGLYLPVGYPSASASAEALHALARSADVLELGVPHHACHLDGPLIQQAAAQALAEGAFRMRDLFTITAELSANTAAALVVMTYWSPVAQFGARRFAELFKAAGGDAVLIPDLPEAAVTAWQKAARDAGLHTIPLVPPQASPAHLATIGAAYSGMVYTPAAPGRTGSQLPLSPHLPRRVHRLRTATGLPVALGIGISTPAHAEQAAAVADAVVVGSAVIRRMRAAPNTPIAAAAAAARDFADAVRRARQAAGPTRTPQASA